jgi:hypothetical protein
MTMQPTPHRQHQNSHDENANTTGAPDVRSAPVAACSGDEEVLEDSCEDEREREQRERDQYPNEMTAEGIDDVVERELLEFEARYDRVHRADGSRPD